MSGAAFLEGTIVSVAEQPAATELTIGVAAGADTVVVLDPDELDLEGGTVRLTDDEDTEVVAYLSVDEETGEVALGDSLNAAYDAGATVAMEPVSLERFAYVLGLEQDEEVEARVPHALYDRLETGIRDPELEPETLRIALEDDEYVVVDVLDREPSVDGSFIDPETTIPGGAITDGEPPTSSPTPTVRGAIRSLFATWDATVNADPVTYEVHVSASSGFTPSASTLHGEIDGTIAKIDHLPNGSAFSYGTPGPDGIGTVPYYVKLIAKDADGSAPASAQGVGNPRQTTSGDVAAENIIASLILADTALFAKLQTLLIISNTLKTATSGARWEADVDGMRVYDSSGALRVNLPTDDTDDFDFIGHLSALGCDLPAGDTATPPADRRVRWLRESDSVAIAELSAYQAGGITQVSQKVVNGLRNQSLTMFDDGSLQWFTLDTSAGADRILHRSDGGSDFVQTPSFGTIRLKAGSESISSGPSPFTDSAAISHGLGPALPAITANVVSDIGAGSQRLFATIRELNATTFVIRVYKADGTNIGAGGVTVKWIAVDVG